MRGRWRRRNAQHGCNRLGCSGARGSRLELCEFVVVITVTTLWLGRDWGCGHSSGSGRHCRSGWGLHWPPGPASERTQGGGGHLFSVGLHHTPTLPDKRHHSGMPRTSSPRIRATQHEECVVCRIGRGRGRHLPSYFFGYSTHKLRLATSIIAACRGQLAHA